MHSEAPTGDSRRACVHQPRIARRPARRRVAFNAAVLQPLHRSCALSAVVLLGYATTSRWPLMVLLGIALGVGGGAIDSGLNTYAATHHGARTLNWLHACYGIGAATGPLIMTTVLGMGLGWQRGYVIVGLAQLVLAVCFGATFRWWERTQNAGDTPTTLAFATIPATLRLKGARLGIVAFFVYAGVEGSA